MTTLLLLVVAIVVIILAVRLRQRRRRRRAKIVKLMAFIILATAFFCIVKYSPLVSPLSNVPRFCLCLLRQLRRRCGKRQPALFERAHCHQSHLAARHSLRAIDLCQKS